MKNEVFYSAQIMRNHVPISVHTLYFPNITCQNHATILPNRTTIYAELKTPKLTQSLGSITPNYTTIFVKLSFINFETILNTEYEKKIIKKIIWNYISQLLWTNKDEHVNNR